MRNGLSLFVVLATLLLGSQASAQFANKSIGASVGYMSLNFDGAVDRSIPLGLDGSLYIENGFDLVANAYLMFLRSNVNNLDFIGMYLNAGVRYLFSEETLRPYVGAGLGFFRTFGGPTEINRVGLSPNVGLDYFVADTVSVGGRGQFTMYFMLNERVATSLGLHATVSAWF